MSVALSVVIPCRDAAVHLPAALEALAGEALDVPWEVVVADNGSQDGTVAVAEAFRDRLTLRVIDASERHGQWFARNRGAAEARGDQLVFLDSDDVIAPGYLAQMRRALAENELVAAHLESERLNPGWVARSRPLGLVEGMNDNLGFLPFANGCCLGARRAAFEALGGFSEYRPTGEDTDLCWRAQLAGMHLGVASGAVLHYRFRNTLQGIFHQALDYGRAETLLYRRFRHRGMPRRRPRVVVREWRHSARRLLRAQAKHERAEALFHAGLALGRVLGSARNRVLYL